MYKLDEAGSLNPKDTFTHLIKDKPYNGLMKSKGVVFSWDFAQMK